MKSYMIARVEITNAQAYREYAERVVPVIAKFGGRFIVRGGKSASYEGFAEPGSWVVLEFPNFEEASRFYNSAQYQEVAAIRFANAQSELILLEGCVAD
jgi:uncharacterized protein (DUF1330 family)